MGPIGCPEKSVTNCQSTMGNIEEERGLRAAVLKLGENRYKTFKRNVRLSP